MTRQMRLVSLTWMVVGSALMMWCAIELWRIGHNSYLGVNSGDFKSTLLAVGFSFLCILGALGVMFKKAWGRIIILTAASMAIIYAAEYFLLGGFEDTGVIYALVVSGLALTGITTTAILIPKRRNI